MVVVVQDKHGNQVELEVGQAWEFPGGSYKIADLDNPIGYIAFQDSYGVLYDYHITSIGWHRAELIDPTSGAKHQDLKFTLSSSCDCGALKARTTHSHWCSSVLQGVTHV